MSTSKEFAIASWLFFLAYPVLAMFDLLEYRDDRATAMIITSVMFLCTAAILEAIEKRDGK